MSSLPRLLPKLPLIQQASVLALSGPQSLISTVIGTQHPHVLEALRLEVVSVVTRHAQDSHFISFHT